MKKLRRWYRAEDGYILLYVMVVVMVLCLMAGAICTSAVRNLKVQQHSVEHMKFVYEAEGIGERFVAELQNVARFHEDGTEKTYLVTKTAGDPGDQAHSEAGKALMVDAVKITIGHALSDPELSDDSFFLLDESHSKIQPEDLIVRSHDGTGRVECPLRFQILTEESSLEAELLVTLLMNRKEDPAGYQYHIQQISYQYVDYKIGSINAQGGAEE